MPSIGPSPFRFTRRGLLSRLGARAGERLLGLHTLDALWNQIGPVRNADEFLERSLAVLGVSIDLPERDLERVPESGPLVIVANHPTGGLDGIVLAAVLRRRRPDLKILANHVLERVAPMRELLISVDPFHGEANHRRNVGGTREAIRHVQAGGAVLIFPAGEVAHRAKGQRSPRDPRWHPGAVRIQQRAGATAVPVLLSGNNGKMFGWAGRVHPNLRTALLPRALLSQRNGAAAVRIGRPIPAPRLAAMTSDQERIDYLRLRTEILGRRSVPGTAQSVEATGSGHPRPIQAIADGVGRDHLAADLSGLPDECLLLESGALQVFCAHAPQIPHVLTEIGRLREHTFRGVGEGTGRALDLDRFDDHYMHLFVWCRDEQSLVGAYRIGRSDHLLFRGGIDGLYTSTLFEMDRRFVDRLGPALELGRSFIVPERQKSYLPLLLLWRGISTWVSRHPRYRVLFGPVSISADHTELSRELMVDHLREHRFDADAADWVRPRNPVRSSRRHDTQWTRSMIADLSEVSSMVADLDPHLGGVPVLLREYLKLGGKLAGFNVDPDFSDAIDGLVIVELDQVDPRILGRYMGKDAAREFLTNGA